VLGYSAEELLGINAYTLIHPDDQEILKAKASEIANQPGAVVTDLVMPRMNGRQLAERLLQLRPDVKVLYMSGDTDDAVVRHGILNRDTSFIPKPFTTDALAQKVREVLDKT
jgi:two-component system, cell cycle sensor histidine kinase and response regulator CckA